jgi:lysozyme
MDARLVQDVKQAEGYSLTAYKDSLEFWTIGYGHLLPDQSKDWTGYTITQDQANAYLEADLAHAKAMCTDLPEWTSLDTPCRQNAVIELEFNMGGKWKSFIKTRSAIQAKNWQAAHDDLLDSLWAKQVGPTRSNRIANYLLTGDYKND